MSGVCSCIVLNSRSRLMQQQKTLGPLRCGYTCVFLEFPVLITLTVLDILQKETEIMDIIKNLKLESLELGTKRDIDKNSKLAFLYQPHGHLKPQSVKFKSKIWCPTSRTDDTFKKRKKNF